MGGLAPRVQKRHSDERIQIHLLPTALSNGPRGAVAARGPPRRRPVPSRPVVSSGVRAGFGALDGGAAAEPLPDWKCPGQAFHLHPRTPTQLHR